MTQFQGWLTSFAQSFRKTSGEVAHVSYIFGDLGLWVPREVGKIKKRFSLSDATFNQSAFISF